MGQSVTFPQPFSSPLNLMYKGAFSTRVSSKRDNVYGHYLDKLYKIQFLGLGTHEATISHDILQAVMLRHMSIGGSEWYRATVDRYSESVILEALGGLPQDRGVSLYDLLAHANRIDSNKPASLLTGLVNYRRLIEYGTVDEGLELKEVKSATIFDVVNAMKEIKIAEEPDTIIGELERLKDAGLLNIAEIGDLLRKADVLDLSEYRKKLEANDSIGYGTYSRIKANVAETIVKTIARKTGINNNQIIAGDEDVLARIVRRADEIHKTMFLAEKIGGQAIKQHLQDVELTDREVILLHYLLFNDNRSYRDAILSVYTDSRKASKEYLEDVVHEMSRSILHGAEKDESFNFIKRYKDVIVESGAELDKVIHQVEEEVKSSWAARQQKKVGIEFNHEVKAEEIQDHLALLNQLYEDFNRMSTEAEVLTTNAYSRIDKDQKFLFLEDYFADVGDSNKTIVSTDIYFGDVQTKVATEMDETSIAENTVISNTHIITDEQMNKAINKEGSVLSEDEHGELWSDEPAVFVGDSRDEEYFAELSSEDEVLSPVGDMPIFAELTSPDSVLSVYTEEELFGELTSVTQLYDYVADEELWVELTNEEITHHYVPEEETFGELTSEPGEFQREFTVEITGTRTVTDTESHVDTEYEIAVFGCSEPDLRYRRRPPLEPDKLPEDPLFEWVCTEGYVCDDWLIVPLKDFNFENPEMEGFYDPITYEPYYPTGQYDANGDPFVLPPYSVLNEPISNGADVGGKEPMSIDPCNLYSFIEYIVKIYDAYKTRFQASNPIDTVSRVMNMLFEQVQKLVSEWDETKGYTPDELWRIYRFIRWMALGITNRFYRVKIEYTYGDFEERFEVFPFSDLIKPDGAVRKFVEGYGWVLDGHPIIDSMENSAEFEFELPKKTRSSTIGFEIGNAVPDRPDIIVPGGVIFKEDFEGIPSNFNIRGDGWVPVLTQGGTGLGVEDPARVRTYRTTTFNVPTNAVNPNISFNYGIDTNLDTKLMLKRTDGTVIWQSAGVVTYELVNISPEPGDYYFEVRVPQAETNNLVDILFTARQIQDEWRKVGYQTEWKVEGNVIYEEENTPGVALVINPQWSQDTEYELEVEFRTEDIPANYGFIDWIGVVLNYKDDDNYYLFGTWSDLDKQYMGGLVKVENGRMVGSLVSPTWQINPDFRFRLSRWHKLKAVVRGNQFTISIDGRQYLSVTDLSGWGHGASGLAAYSNPMSSFRNFKYKGKPRFDAFIDNVKVEATHMYEAVEKPKYAIDFYLDGDTPRIEDYLSEGKRAYSFPILEGEHKARWKFRKIGSERSIPQDASFVDNIVVKGMKIVGAEVIEEFISCGGHLAVKILIENLLEYYRRHHQGCKGERNIWIVE